MSTQVEQLIDPEGYNQRLAETIRALKVAKKISLRREDARLVAAFSDANAAVGANWNKLEGTLAFLGFDKINYEKEAFKIISGTAEYLAYQASVAERNELAFKIMQNPLHYEEAIEAHSLELKKLEKYSDQHRCADRVRRYVEIGKTEAILDRDRLATEIARNIKEHYSYLQSVGCDVRELNAQALNHSRRELLATLTEEECEAFTKVELYQTTAREIGAWWSATLQNANNVMRDAPLIDTSEKSSSPSHQIESENLGTICKSENVRTNIPPLEFGSSSPSTVLKHEEVERIEKLSLERNHLAHEILNNRARYDKALDFYQIGIAAPRFGETPTVNDIQKTQARWDKLTQNAMRHEQHERVLHYHRALSCGDLKTRMQLAHEIKQNTKAHHGSVIGLKMNTKEIWFAICADAKRFERYDNYRKLDLVDRLGFKAVESYVEAKRAHGTAWRELIESKEAANWDKNQLYATADAYVDRYTKIRDQFAADVFKNPALFQAGLDYFNINLDDLEPQAYKHQCRENVDNYQKAGDFITRATEAYAIISDPKAHHGFVLKNGLDWKAINRDARVIENQKFFESAGIEAKSIYRLSDRYRLANQTAGKIFSRLKEDAVKDPLSVENSARVAHLFAKRDYLAWRLVSSTNAIDPDFLGEFCYSEGLKIDNLLKQQTHHADRLAAVEQGQVAYQEVVRCTREVYRNSSASADLDSLQKAFTAVEQANYFQKVGRFNKPESLHYALDNFGLHKNTLIKQVKSLSILKTHLQEKATLNKMDTNKIREKSSEDIRTLPEIKTNYQKIDVKRLREDLNARAEEVALRYLGDPKARNGGTWRYGANKGSLVVTVHGQKQGLWRDFQTSEGGDMLTLIGHAMGASQFKDILEEATRFIGGYSHYVSSTPTPAQKQTSPDLDAFTLQKIQKAQAIFNATKPIEGSIAERYLREHRGIQNPLFDKTFRFHPNLKNWMTGDIYPALVLAARDEKNTVTGVQAIFLDPTTAKKAPLGNNAKLSRGLIGEGAMINPGLPGGKIAFAEGPETALSVAEAHPDWKVYVTFGVSNFDKVPLKAKSPDILICADNDGPGSGTAKSVERAAKILAQKGINVWVAEPEKPDDQKKWDFNDALKTQGVEQVKKDLDKAILYKAAMTKERNEKEIKTTLAELEKSSEKLNSANLGPKSIELSEIQKMSMQNVLRRYLDMGLKYITLLKASHKTQDLDYHAEQKLTQAVISQAKSIDKFAYQAINHPEIKENIHNLKGMDMSDFSERGGFPAIYDRLQNGELVTEDKQALLVHLNVRALSQRKELENQNKNLEKSKPIDWKRPEYQKEFDLLRTHENPIVQQFVKLYDQLCENDDSHSIRSTSHSMEDLARKIVGISTFQLIKELAPNLGKAMENAINNKKSRGIDR